MQVIVHFAAPALASPASFDTPAAADAAQTTAVHAMQDQILGAVFGSASLARPAADAMGLKRMDFSPMFAISVTADQLASLAANSQVLRIQEDELAKPVLDEAVPLVGMTAAYAAGATGAGWAVVVLDSGTRRTHEFVSGKVVSAACYSTTNASYPSESYCPGGAPSSTAIDSANDCDITISGCGHGTHVSGIAAGNNTNRQAGEPANGVSRDGTLITINVFSKFTDANLCGGMGPCILSYTTDQILGLERVYALRNTFNIAAINMSLGGGQNFAACDYDVRKPIIDLLKEAGIATLIAAGNNGFDDSVSTPGCISSAITVGSSDKSDARSVFSNWGTLIDIVAPGSHIFSSVANSDTSYGSKSGTSMATPMAAGAFAAIRSAYPTATVDRIESALKSTGLGITAAGVTKPRIRVDQALAAVPGQAANTITFPALPDTAFNSNPPVPAAFASSGLAVSYSSATSAVCIVMPFGDMWFVGTGTCSITASQAGDANFLAATPVTRSFSVTKGTNFISFSPLPNIVFGDAPPVIDAIATTFLDITFTSTSPAVCTVTGTRVITILLAGTCSITASQAGNANYLAAVPVSRSFSVYKGATTTTVTTSATNTPFGASITMTANVAVTVPASATPVGVVTFIRGYDVVIGSAPLVAGQAMLTVVALPSGVNSIRAAYDVAGDDPRLALSSSSAVTVFVAKQATTTNLTVAPNPVMVGGNATATATVTGIGASGSVTFKDGANDVAVVALVNGTATAILSPPTDGLRPITAVYGGDTNSAGSTSNVVNLLAHSSCADAFAGALSLAGANGTVFGSTVGATGEAGEPNHAGNSGALNSVWCTWTAPAAGTVTIDTTGSGFDTTLAVNTGASVDALTAVAANDNIGPGSTQSRVSFAATAGVAYRIAIDGVSATGDYVLNIALAPAETPVTFASVLPTARSITTKTVATAFATIINSGAAPATGCSLAAPPGFPADFSYQTTDATNAPSGTANTPVDIAAGAAQGFFFAVTPLVDLNSSEFAIVFDCTNTPTTVTVPGLNTLLLSASSTPVPDLISIGATPSGDGIANIPGPTGVTAFGAATVNIGATDVVTASIDDNGRGLALTALLCVTDPATGAYTNPAAPAPSVSFSLANGTSATVAVFVTGTGIVPFDPGANRLFLRFKTADGVTRGATSVAVRTQ